MPRVLVAVLGLAALIGGCSPPPPAEPLADPRVVFANAFAAPAIHRVSFVATGGPPGDAWLVFSTDDRLELVAGERYAVLAPAAAVEFFTTAAPEPAAELPGTGLVCLAHRDLESGDRGAYLLFEPGSGRYFYRAWDR